MARRGSEKPERRASAERQPAVVARHRIRRRLGTAGLLAGLAILGALIGITWWQESVARARIPPPPSVGHSAAVAEHLRGRHAAAQRDPTIDTIGPLCVAYHADMFFDHAERCYALAMELAPDDWRWIYHVALIQSERGGGEALVASLRRVIDLAPTFGPAWLRLGEAEFKAGRYEQAMLAWQRAQTLREPEPKAASAPRHRIEVPLPAYASLGLARVAMVRGESDLARGILEALIAAAPEFGSAHRLLAEIYRSLGRQSESDRSMYRARRLPPYSPYADPIVDELALESRNSVFLLRLASEASLAVNAEWSEFLTVRALEVDPDNPDVVLKLGRVLRTVGRNEEALEFFLRYHQMVPEDYQGLAHIGGTLSEQGRYEEAESHFRRALTRLDDPVTHYNLGLLLSRTGRLDEAIGEYEKALERDSSHSDARTNLATTLARQGKLDRASRELARVLESDPENTTALTNLGLILLEQGSVDQARAHLEEAVRLDSGLQPAVDALASIESRSRR